MSTTIITIESSWWAADLPSWIVAIATVGALIAAVVAARHAFNLLKIEAERDKRSLAEIEGRQAFLVEAFEARGPGVGINDTWIPGKLVVRFMNWSPVSVFEATVQWYSHDTKTPLDSVTLNFVVPSSETKWGEYPVPEMVDPDPNESRTEQWPFIFQFRDRAGRYWRQDFLNHVAQVSEEEFRMLPVPKQ